MKIRPLLSLSVVAAVVLAGAVVIGCSKSSNKVTNPGTGGNPSFDTGLQNVGFTKDVTFPVAGAVNYYCTLHGTSGMVGSVTIDAASSVTLVNVSVAPGGALTFSPTNVTIKPGGTVHWVWAGSNHSVTSGTPAGPSHYGMKPMSGMDH